MLAPATALRAEWRSLAELGAVRAAWTGLASRAAEPNVFYEPSFALAAAPVFGRGVGAILVWGDDGRLVGLFPLRRARRPLPMFTGWTHPFAPLGTPLVDRDALAPVVGAALDWLAGDERLPKLMLFPLVRYDGPVAAALDSALAARGLRSAVFGTHERPLLHASSDARYLDNALSGQRRREFARKRQKLAETASLALEIDDSAEAVARTLGDFSALEVSGWKGRAGTAIAQDAEVARFVSGAVTGLAAEGKVIAARLVHGGRAIAAILVLRSAAGAWGWKVAYDEEFSRASPGVLLLLEVTERLAAHTDIAWCDSCAAPGQPVFGTFWRERLAIADRLVAVTPSAPFGLACRTETWRRGLEAAARRARNALRDRLRAVTAKGT